MAIPINRIISIPPDSLKLLEKEGITSVEQFYDIASHNDTRAELAKKTGINEFTLEGWSADAGNVLLMLGMVKS